MENLEPFPETASTKKIPADGPTGYRFHLMVILLAFAAMLLSVLFHTFRNRETDIQQQLVNFSQQFRERDEEAKNALADFVQLYEQAGEEKLTEDLIITRLNDKYGKKGMTFFLFSGDTLTLWTNNSIPFYDEFAGHDEFGIRRLGNGWYFIRRHTDKNDRKFLVVSVIKTIYHYQNKFLVNEFYPGYEMPTGYYFITDRPQEGFVVQNHDDQYAFSVNIRRATGLYGTSRVFTVISILLAIGGLLMLVFFLFRLFSQIFHHKSKMIGIGGFILLMGLLRMLMFFTSLPQVIHDPTLFSPALYATSNLLPSLGDLFINILFFSIIAFFLFVNLRQFSFKSPLPAGWRVLLSFAVYALIYLFCNLTVFLLKSLVIDSHLNFNVNFIFSIDIYSLVGFMIIGCIFFTFYFLGVVLFRLTLHLAGSPLKMRIVFLMSVVVAVLLHWALSGPAFLQWLLYVSAIMVYEAQRKSPAPETGFTPMLVSLLLFSLISSYALFEFNLEKDLSKRKTLALQIASEQDPVAEFLFMEMEEDLFNDHQLINLVRNDPYNITSITRYLQHHYFYDFWARYNLQVTVCKPEEVIRLMPANVLIDCEEYFIDYISSFGNPTISEKLVYLDNNTGMRSYIAMIPVKVIDEEIEEEFDEYFIFLEFDAKYVARDLGLPDLLIDERIDLNRDLDNYTYATYKDGLLITKSGKYNYSMTAAAYNAYEDEFNSFVFEGYRHLLFRKDDQNMIMISRPVETFLDAIAPFSYLFVLFFFMVVLFYMFTSKKSRSEIFRLNFKRRVRASMVTIVVVSVLAIGGASAWFIVKVSANKELATLREKTQSVLSETEISLNMSNINHFTERSLPYLSEMLMRQSNIFFTDINLYGTDGRLLASSRWEVFEEGLSGTLMDPVAFFTLRNHRLNQFIHIENIGKLQYLSAYIVLRNPFQEVLGYINLPYFAKQGELRDEISYFLVAFINIYLLLLVIAIVVAVFISNFVTQPLQLIRESLSKVQLGRTNQKIEWSRNDEIGGLVTEYNRMIDELGESANLLARSERETAWREMAKQVAHEIKNPLTPMRLNIQYLEKAWKEKAPDWDDRLARFSKTMVEQIDNLALIAAAFSDFARMPSGNNNKLNFRKFLHETLNLFNDTDKVAIDLKMPAGDQPLVIRADKGQLIRVINNLVNNAIQSYPKHTEALVEVKCSIDDSELTVEVTDYGCGIPESLKSNIFSPNFTTKTSGMGLGLSMVKAIIENLGGRVGFSSEESRGSRFFFTIPLAGMQ